MSEGKKPQAELTTAAWRRVLRLGGLMSRVGTSLAANRLLTKANSPARIENLIGNAQRVAETLGELKGATMKVGQMLSLHEGLLPPEVAEVLRSLQQEAPPVPPEVMEYEIRGVLPLYDDIFESIDFEAFAAASIGQVHNGVLKDGRPVAVKIQYPCIDQIVKADLKNLRLLVKSIFSMFYKVDFDPIWTEVRDRLFEELDYTHEADNLRTMAELHANVPEIVIPDVIEQASTTTVLTMTYVGGIPPDEACSDTTPQDLKDRWGIVLFEFLLRGLLKHRVLHADPNLANFAFRDDGRVVVYDFGCLKRVPAKLSRGYASLLHATTQGHPERIPAILGRIGVTRLNGDPVEVSLVNPWYDLLSPVGRAEPPFTFGEDETLYERILEISLANWNETSDLAFHEDVVFIDRTLAGHFGNLARLKATGPWRDLILRYAKA